MEEPVEEPVHVVFDNITLFGCLHQGELVLRGPRFHGPIFPPHPGQPDSTAAWLRETMTGWRPDDSQWYTEAIVMIPFDEIGSDVWNACLEREGFVPISNERYIELLDPAWQWALGPVARRTVSSIWRMPRVVTQECIAAARRFHEQARQD